MKTGEIELAASGMVSEITEVANFLFRQAAAPHLPHAQVLDGFGRDLTTGSFFKTAVDSSRGFGAELLKHNRARQSFERWLAIGDAIRPHAFDDRSHYDVRGFQMVESSFHVFRTCAARCDR